MAESSSARILIVDDMPINIKVLSDHLKPYYQILVATNGPKALQIANDTPPPDMVLLDIMMPEMDGYEVCRQLKENPATKEIPIIFVTALTETEDETRGLEMGAVDYITKPFQPAIIRARIHNHLALKRKVDLLESMAFLDGLTEIPNRRFFDHAFEREWKGAVRESTSLSLMILDIDFFKKVNDTHGHAAGDECLKQVAASLAKVIQRPEDILVRMGGEEFGVLLPNTAGPAARRLAEQMRANVEATRIQPIFSEAVLQVTISIGVATIFPDKASNSKLLFETADAALYESKEGGRNRVTCRDLEP
ncbi:MAG: diguanylate cyclase [Magnetococcales bacterium]|nr:diguanylate cyclase [Magnetococcales bacterium]